jgi:Mce-associated membrane protein
MSAEPAVDEQDADPPDEIACTQESAEPERTPRRRWWPAAALCCVAAALVATGVVLLARGVHSRTTGPAGNRALIDSSRTEQVIGQVSTALNAVLSYSYQAPQTARAAAATWLTGDAVGQYRLLFSELNARAPGQKLTFTAKVITAGVTDLRGDHADLLVFLDQRSTRASDHATSVAAAQVQITAVRSGSRWRISELHPL